MQYPLKMRFRLLAFAQRISIADAAGQPVLYVRQKMFRLKEHVLVYRDSSEQEHLFDIKADRMIDFSANYSFTSPDGTAWGAVRRRGARSLWSAHYEVMEDGNVDMTISEESPFKKLIESIAGEIPIIGLFVTYFLNPTYLVTAPDGTPLMRIIKKPAFFEGSFVVEKLAEVEPDDELRLLLSFIMVVLLERKRG